MIDLHWFRLSDTRIAATLILGTDNWTFLIERKPSYDSYPAMTYEYHASAVLEGVKRHELDTHKKSTIAQQKCADFINSIQQQKG